ncbi:unnamed protein product [Paramecium pentaurelia]|uniref:Uncharacterized protein n=1 Tax=Paramecium pentaurelia TaxID=43138 RepID=A0A8S1X3B1_9CILI|nr:unnamed protein product [Paramecium pentaurelia]
MVFHQIKFEQTFLLNLFKNQVQVQQNKNFYYISKDFFKNQFVKKINSLKMIKISNMLRAFLNQNQHSNRVTLISHKFYHFQFYKNLNILFIYLLSKYYELSLRYYNYSQDLNSQIQDYIQVELLDLYLLVFC